MRFLRPSSATRIIIQTDAAANPDSLRAEDAPAPAPEEASLAAEDDAVDIEPPPADTADAFPTSRRRFSMVIRAPAPSEATEEDAAPTDSPLLRTVRCCMGADAPAPEEVPAEEEAPSPAQVFEEGECPICMELIDGESGKEAKPWPTDCQHRFCVQCWTGCINRSLRCPLCRAEAPASARPTREIDREVVLSMIQQIRLQELERFRREQEARRNRGRIVPRMPSTRVGRFLNRRVNAMDQWLDTLLDG